MNKWKTKLQNIFERAENWSDNLRYQSLNLFKNIFIKFIGEINKMKRNLTVNIGIMSGFAFLITFFLGVGILSQTIWKEIVPFMGIIIFVVFAFSGKSCCRSKRNC